MNAEGKVIGVLANLVTVRFTGDVAQNETCYVSIDDAQCLGEVIKIQGNDAIVQVFESTRGLRYGNKVSFLGRLLEVQLGPGMLSRNYDGLQNDLDAKEGTFLKRGDYTPALKDDAKWDFDPLVKEGSTVGAGDWLGQVKELWLDHKIMVPFTLAGELKVKKIASKGSYTIKDVIAVLETDNAKSIDVTMSQYWPVKRPIHAYVEKPRPTKVMETGIRIIDMFNPMAEGGTGFVPGPFGCGKTVLQHAMSKNADADVIIIAACGERANEVVEIFTDYPEIIDPRTGRGLMERTIIICNTSNMPVAAREASVYTGMTIAEYFRQMGLRVLLLADSTSRWAQALREMSNRLEELPGPDGFPMDLPAVIANFYARSGQVLLQNGASGSVTFIGTVSPAGGNLKEPVTENTKKVARCFYALAQPRADSKRYPAIDPLDSYSKYLDYPEIQEWLSAKVGPEWVPMVKEAMTTVRVAKDCKDQIAILGDDGVSLDYHVKFWKGELVDFILMQQDAFDRVDANVPLERQKLMLEHIIAILRATMKFEAFHEVATYFKKLINTGKQMNYSEFKSNDYYRFEKEFLAVVAERVVA